MSSKFIDRIVTYGTPAFLLGKDLIGKIAQHPEFQKKAAEQLIKAVKGGRTRSDELIFITSLISLVGVSAENKQLFLNKHYKLLNPALSGKTVDQIKELRQKEKLAKGLIFLIAEDTTTNNSDESKRFQYAKEVWHGIFLNINTFPDDNAKMQVLEQRILHFGKNHQEQMSLEEVVEKIRPHLPKIDSVAKKVAESISSINNILERKDSEGNPSYKRNRKSFWKKTIRR